ncbi:hypothetical protein BSFA1_63720 (plasmid) [Burkholderia sp. SFA1]|nr:hypothetical protein BSFA1_63720 [Burkholderia sp. SFA1]
MSTLYRLSAVLGWVELYRQEITFLHSKSNAHAQALERAVGHFRSDFADGHINEESDWYQWRDTLIFREELRAIGESMIESRATVRTVMGYGRYIECLEASSPNPVQRWAPVVLNFFVELETNGKDFRRVRMQRAYLHLFALLSALNPSLLNEHMQGLRNTINEANKHVRQYEPPS